MQKEYNMKIKLVQAVFVATALLTASTWASGLKIITAGQNSADILLELDSLKQTSVEKEGAAYSVLQADGFGLDSREGMPALPIAQIAVLTARDPMVRVTREIIAADTIRNIVVSPSSQKRPALANQPDLPTPFVRNACYSSDLSLPVNGISDISTIVLSGMPLTKIIVSPVSYNPVRKELIVYRSVKYHFTYSAANSSALLEMSSKQRAQLASVASNYESLTSGISLNSPAATRAVSGKNDVLIITTPAYKAAADSLAVWQRMKGLGSMVDARASWSSDAVKTRTTEFYKSTTPHPGFVLLLGGIVDVPASYMSESNTSFPAFPTDLAYVCMDGSNDHVADMAGGRIACTTADEAMTIVKKIITYEKTPPMLASFYTTVAGASYWNDDAPPYGEEDDGFVRTCEIVRAHLKKSNITADHLYYAAAQNGAWEATNPQTYWSDGVGFDPKVAADIKVPNYGWNATAADINASLDNGRFLLYHYDHGLEQMWGQPAYNNSKIDQLKNGELLPVVLSIDCLCGNFNYASGPCLAQKFISKDAGGAVGAIAASTPSYEGTNDILMCGIVDAIWPGIDFASMFTVPSNAVLASHAPLSSMGEVLNQGKFEMLVENPDAEMSLMHVEMYHFFGDPAMRIWTGVPVTISPSHNSIVRGTGNLVIENIGSIESGMASLVNPKTGELIGTGSVVNGAASVDLNGIPDGTELTLTITGKNVRPYISKITVDPNAPVSINQAKMAGKFSASVVADGVQLAIPQAGTWSVTIYSLNGRKLWSSKQTVPAGSTFISFEGIHSAAGATILSIEGPGVNSVQKMILQ